MIWTITAWAFLPASLFMRGIAMQRVADDDHGAAAAPRRAQGAGAGCSPPDAPAPSRLALALALFGAGASHAETLRIATYHAELGRKGPGLLSRRHPEAATSRSPPSSR